MTSGTAEMRNGAAISLAALLADGYALMPVLGNYGRWAALAVFAAFRGLTLAYWYPRLLRRFAVEGGGAAGAKTL